MSLHKPKQLSGLKAFCVNVLKQGLVPRHIAFIMDGNRRFARVKHVDQMDGHKAGFKKLVEVINWCRDIGVPEVTVYAFSIENFKRSQEEVDNLLNLFKQRFEQLWEERQDFKKGQICVRVVGNVQLFPKDIQNSIAKIVLYTKDFNKQYLNLALAYTGREELYQALNNLLEGVEKGIIEPDDITEDSLQQCLYTYTSPDPEILIRTSGEVRLSDFLLWQTSYSLLMFISSLWPDLSLWSFLSSVFYYQCSYNKTKDFKDKYEESKNISDYEFIKKKLMEKKPTCSNNNNDEKCLITEAEFVAYKEKRENRLKSFYLDLEKKRNAYWNSMIVEGDLDEL